MTRRVKIDQLKLTNPKVQVLNPEEVATALGAELTDQVVQRPGSPLALWLLRQDLVKQLQSRGGRPSLSAETVQKKIPVSQESWKQLEEIAETLSEDLTHEPKTRIRKVTAAQVASRLLHLLLAELSEKSTTEENPLLSVLQKHLDHSESH